MKLEYASIGLTKNIVREAYYTLNKYARCIESLSTTLWHHVMTPWHYRPVLHVAGVMKVHSWKD